MTIRSKSIPPGSGNFYMYEQKSQRSGKKVNTKHVRYIGKGHHGAGQGPSQSVVPNQPGTNPTFQPEYRSGGLNRFTAAPTKDPFPELDKRKNEVGFTQLDGSKEQIQAHRNLAKSFDNIEGEYHKVVQDRGNWFYVHTTAKSGSFKPSKRGVQETGSYYALKSDKFNAPIKASESAKVVPNKPPQRKKKDTGYKSGRSDVQVGFEGPSQPDSIPAQFTVKEGA